MHELGVYGKAQGTGLGMSSIITQPVADMSMRTCPEELGLTREHILLVREHIL